jgi:hypothetical protein
MLQLPGLIRFHSPSLGFFGTRLLWLGPHFYRMSVRPAREPANRIRARLTRGARAKRNAVLPVVKSKQRTMPITALGLSAAMFCIRRKVNHT